MTSGCALTSYADPPAASGTPSAAASPSTPTDPAPSTTPAATEGAAATEGEQPTAAATPDDPAPAGSAAATLDRLRVAGRAPMTGYSRERFGQAWLDADRNGCDTRNDVLRRDLRRTVLSEGTHGCVVLSGVLEDPYTGSEIDFVRGGGVSVDVDHVVALGNAWSSGAGRLDVQTRAALANDPLELLAVDAGANRSKGDADAASWLPPVRAFRCAYAARQVAVKAKYGLAVTPAEKAAVIRVLAGCPDEPLPRDPTHAPTRVDQRVTDPGAPGAATPATPASPSGGGGQAAAYARCDDARAAGATPLHRGDPGWSESLDRDHDGTACE